RGALHADFLENIHHNQAIRIDQRLDLERDTDLLLLVAVEYARAAERARGRAVDVRNRGTDKQIRLHTMRGLDARTRKHVHTAVGLRRLQGDIEVVPELAPVAEHVRRQGGREITRETV